MNSTRTPEEIMEFLLRWVLTFGEREVGEERWDQDWYSVHHGLTADHPEVVMCFDRGYKGTVTGSTNTRKINQRGLDFIKEKQK